MTCGRCNGFMVVEPIPDALGSPVSSELHGSRCVNCGNIEDAAIYTNRLKDRSTRRPVRRNVGVEGP